MDLPRINGDGIHKKIHLGYIDTDIGLFRSCMTFEDYKTRTLPLINKADPSEQIRLGIAQVPILKYAHKYEIQHCQPAYRLSIITTIHTLVHQPH